MEGGAEAQLGRRLAAARAYSGKSKIQVSKCVGVSEWTIGRWERGDWKSRPPAEGLLREVARCNGVPDWFILKGLPPRQAEDADEHAALSVQATEELMRQRETDRRDGEDPPEERTG